jgi:hypothetical protein
MNSIVYDVLQNKIKDVEGFLKIASTKLLLK